MTKEEAIIYLPIDEDDDLQDLYDEKLFELKQFFLNRFPMSKLIHSRLKKFEKVEEAFVSLGGLVPDLEEEAALDVHSFSSLKEVFAWYNREKNRIRLRLSSAESVSQVRMVLSNYIQLTKHYAEHWKVPIQKDDKEIVKIAVEPNPMDLQEALNELIDEQIANSDFISSLPDENHLKSEAKRLSLWLNFESDEQSIR